MATSNRAAWLYCLKRRRLPRSWDHSEAFSATSITLASDTHRPGRVRRPSVLPVYRREMGISELDGVRGLLNGCAWLPPGLEPTG
jgi:hypothetical protein